MEPNVDFKSKFYNIDGIHINDRKKNFQKLLKSTQNDIPEIELEIQPRNQLERIFYVDALIYFKKKRLFQVEVLKQS